MAKQVPAAPSFVRTLVPFAVGQIVAFAASLGIEVSESQEAAFTTVLGFVVAAIWYVVFRWLEQKWPKLGIFLGWAKTPGEYARNHPTVESSVTDDKIVGNGPAH